MRDIKFRAWDKQLGRMLSDAMPMRGSIWWDNGASFDGKGGEYDVMQFTGIVDKDNKPVYEGDVIKTFWQHDGHINRDYEIVGVVSYSEDMAQFVVTNDAKDQWCPFYSFDREEYFPDYTEVLGNIYEHPHLLDPQP
jgi:uncharacterized phage protein (TIGR01671 family)